MTSTIPAPVATDDSTTADPTNTAPTTSAPDVIDTLLGESRAAQLADIRALRPEARLNAQRSFDALFSPADATELSLLERDVLAAFATGLHRDAVVGPFYAERLAANDGSPESTDFAAALAAELQRGATSGPYGIYREDKLTGESTDGLRFTVSDAGRATFGPRLTAALEHVHLLVFRPRESSPQALDALLAAGWSVTGIVTLSQLVAFLAFQIRVVHGLSVLAAAPASSAASATSSSVSAAEGSN
jgi:CMD domain protein